ncbi:MAG: hypothetical protein U0163_12015 [Gemmatimonadaceae bacterium]
MRRSTIRDVGRWPPCWCARWRSASSRYQRADGKITHEISQGAGKIDWFGEGIRTRSITGTRRHSGFSPLANTGVRAADTALVRELWLNLRKAFEWSRRADSDGDGLMENTIAGAGALELGDLQAGIVSDVYLSGVWIASLERFARMAEAMREPALYGRTRHTHEGLADAGVQALPPALGQYAFAILEWWGRE